MFAAAFREDLGLDVAGVPVLVDESLRTYAMLGFKRSLLSTLSPKIAVHAVRALLAGHRQAKTQGDAMQLGGVVVVRPDGHVVYGYASDEAGDHPDPSVIVEAVRRAVQSGDSAHAPA